MHESKLRHSTAPFVHSGNMAPLVIGALPDAEAQPKLCGRGNMRRGEEKTLAFKTSPYGVNQNLMVTYNLRSLLLRSQVYLIRFLIMP